MTNLKDLTTQQLKRIIAIKEQIEELEGQIESIEGGGVSEAPAELTPKGRKKHKMSAAGRRAIAAAAKARWAKIRGEKSSEAVKPKRRKMSAAARKKIAAAAKARWAKAKAAGKKTL